jgi:hypothetical protein
MKARLTIAAAIAAITAITAAGSLSAGAQNVTADPQADPVHEAIQAFNQQEKNRANEVTVVLDPVGEPPAPVADDTGVNQAPKAPVLVTAPPPETPATVSDEPGAAAAIPGEEAPKAQPGLTVRIEKLQTVKGAVDPATIKLLAPFPAKPLAEAPAGWHLEASESAPPFTRKVELAPGSEVTLSVRPHLLVPDADGAEVFSIAEPGYEASLGYQQTATVGAVLSKAIQQLENDSKLLGTAIDSLQQLLISLPKPEPQPEAAPAPAPARKR